MCANVNISELRRIRGHAHYTVHRDYNMQYYNIIPMRHYYSIAWTAVTNNGMAVASHIDDDVSCT